MDQQKNIFKERARFFVIKSNSVENLELSMQSGVWATTRGPTMKLAQAYDSVENVILIFSVNESSCIQGIARMETKSSKKIKPHVRFTSDFFVD